MATALKLNKPWMVAVWPGMGHVAISAGYYLMAKLGMHILAEFPAHELFDVEHVEVKDGLISTGRLPRSRFFVWIDPAGPARHRRVHRRGAAVEGPIRLLPQTDRVCQDDRSRTGLHVRGDGNRHGARTPNHESSPPRPTRRRSNELKQLELQILDDGNIGGLNGILLGVAAESWLRGGCLLGEMPHIFAQLPYPKASLAVLEAFTDHRRRSQIDLTELAEQAREMDHKLGELLAQMQKAMQQGRRSRGRARGHRRGRSDAKQPRRTR